MGYKRKYEKLVELIRQEIAIKEEQHRIGVRTATPVPDAAVLTAYLRQAESA